MSDAWVFVAVVLVGVVAGILGGMFGIGGASVSTPMIRLLGATAFESVGSTLPAILPSSFLSAARYHRAKQVQWPIARVLAISGCTTAIVGAWAARSVPGEGRILMIATSLFVGWGAIRVLTKANSSTESPDEHDEPVSRLVFFLIGSGSGLLSGLLGLGGGVIMVPMLHTWGRLTAKHSIATSLAAQIAFVIPAAITHALLGNINWKYAIPLMIGPLIGAPIGAGITLRAKERTTQLAVGSALLTTAIVYGVAETVGLLNG